LKIISVNEPIIAGAISFGPFKRIYIGTLFNNFDVDAQKAILAHEKGHLVHHHWEKGLFVCIFLPFFYKKYRQCQEFQADFYAAERGHGKTLIRVLESVGERLRVHQLKVYEQTRLVPVKNLSPGSA
jgi:Zn-dependent protease with chaperone function